MSGTPAAHPRIFDFNPEVSNSIPVLVDKDIADFSSIIKSLARGTYPRPEAVPNALNAVNLTLSDEKTWAYFHDITDIAAVDDQPQDTPTISLDDEVIADLNTSWQGMRPEDPQLAGPKARYRFICFIHRHRLNTRYSGQRDVYTISIWDRECDWMCWHDMYPHGRLERQKDVAKFWEVVQMDDVEFLKKRNVFVKHKIRWRLTYHACERVEAGLRDIIPPRHTLWSVMAIGLHHMAKGTTDRLVHLVPDRFEVFSGAEDVYLPALFVRLIWLFMRAPREGQEQSWIGKTDGFNDDKGLKRSIEQFRIADRLPWMKEDVRRVLEAFMRGDPTMDWLKSVTWFFPALSIPPP